MSLRDSYRVVLFKKKIRMSIPDVDFRFAYSIDGQHLVIPLFMRFYGKTNEVSSYMSAHLSKAKIDHKVIKDKYGLYRDWPEHERPVDCISIPIDQEAFPELRRRYSRAKIERRAFDF